MSLRWASIFGQGGIGRPALAVLAARLVGLAAAWLLALVLSNQLGAEASGQYYVVIAVVSIGATLGGLGLQNATLRFVAIGKSDADWASVAGVLRLSVSFATLASISIAALLIAAPGLVSISLLRNPTIRNLLPLAAFLVPVQALAAIQAGALKGLGRPVWAMTLTTSLPPLIALGLLRLAKVTTAEGAILALGAGFTGSVIGNSVVWLRVTGRRGLQLGQFAYRELLRTALPLLLAGSLHLVVQWADTIILGAITGSSAVGIYSPALRTATLLTVFLAVVNSIVSPRFAVLHNRGETTQLEAVARNASWIGIGASTPILIVILFGASQIMGLFGPEFSSGANALRILAVAQFINTVAGPCGNLLAMTGHQRLIQRTTLIAATLNIILNLALIPPWGIEGAAVATALAVIWTNLANAQWVRRRLMLEPIALLPARNS